MELIYMSYFVASVTLILRRKKSSDKKLAHFIM